MKRILSLILAVLMIASVFTAIPVMAQDDVVVLNENYGKVKITGKVQGNGSIAFGVRSSFGDSETQDIIQYFVSPRGIETSYGMESNQAFDFSPSQELVAKTSSTLFSNGTKSGGDERTPVSLSGFGWIGAGHGMTCAVNISGTNNIDVKNVGDIYKDKDGIEWVLLRVTEVSKEESLVFISKNIKSGKTDTNPAFYTLTDAYKGTDFVNVNDENNKVTISSYKSGSWLRPAYNMTKQDVYVVNDGEKTLVQANGSTLEGDYVLVEETYTIMNPVYVAQAIIDGKPEGGYTENPNLAVGKPLVTFDLQHIYNPDGTVVHNWETTYHQDANISVWGGIQYGKKGDFIYLPQTKPFTANSSVDLNSVNYKADNVAFDFSNRFDSTTGFPTTDITTDRWVDASYAPNRRLDFNKVNGVFDKAFAGGQLPVFDNVNSERIQNTAKTNYMYKSRKAYFHSASDKINERYPNLTNVTLKGSAYKNWIADFDDTYSYYSVPYFSDGDSSRYFYFDLYQPGVTKKYDISAYLGTYSVAELEKSANLEYNIDYTTGILTVSSAKNNQTAADYLVLKAKYVGESVPAVEMKMRALPTLYNESINDKLAEIAEMMETVGAPESDYNPELLANYKSLLAQKEAYEQAIKDEAANAERVAGLDNKFDFVELYLFQDVFATYKERMSKDWYEWTTGEGEITTIWPFKGITNGITPVYPMSRSKDSDGWVMAINFDGKSATAYKNAVSLETNPMVSFDEKLGRHIVNTENTKYKLGEIAEGKFGGNFATFAVTYNLQNETIADGLGIKEQVLNTSVYPNLGTSSRMDNATYTINKSGVSEINLLLTTMQVSSSGKDRSMRVPCTIEYTDGEPETIGLLVSTIGSSFQDTVFAAPKTSTTYADINTNKVAAKTVLGKDVTNENSTVSSALQKLYMPEESFILATHLRSYESGAFDGYVSSFSIPVDPTRTIKSVKLQNISSSITESFTEGSTIANATSGTSRIAFVPVTIDGASEDYNYYIHVTRACGSSGIFAMTLTNAETWLDRIASVEAKMLALDAQTATYADVEALRTEIAELLAQNSNIVYVKDFSAEARANIDNVEEALKAAAAEAERIENLSKNVFDHVDMNKQGNKDLYATVAEFTKATGQFGYNNTLVNVVAGCTPVEKTKDGVAYKEYYTLDNYLVAVQDVANDTYYYNTTNTDYQENAYTFLGEGYKFKYVAGTTKTYYGVLSKDGTTKSSTGSLGGVYAWYHDGKGPYHEKSAVAENKAIIYNAAVSNGDSLLALLTDVKTYTAKDLVTGKDVNGKTGKITTAGGTEFNFGPIAPSNSATVNGFILTDKNATITFGEDGVKADYINILASIHTTNNVNVAFDKVTVYYENEDGSLGQKDFGIILGKTGSKSAGIYSKTVQEVVEGSIFKVAKTKAQNTFSNRLSNKESVPGISLDDVTFGTKVADNIIYPTEMLNVGTMFTQHTFYPNPGEANAGVYKLPVSEFYKVKSIVVQGNFGCGSTFTESKSDFYVEGTQQSGNSVAVPVTVNGGDENYNYYAIYSPTWTNRAVLYAVNTEKLPVIDKITAIEAKMATASTTADVEEIEGLIGELTADGSVVYPKDFNKEIVDAYEAIKEAIDVSAVVELKEEATKVTVKATISNPVRAAGKKYTVIVAFYDKDKNLITAKVNPFTTTADKEIVQNVVITDLPENADDVKVFVWKDFETLKVLTK